MANLDDLNITLDSILEILSDVKGLLKTKQEALTKEDRILLQQILESRNQPQPQPKIDFNPKELEQLKATIKELKSTIRQPTKVENSYSIDFKANKPAMAVVTLVLFLIISIFGNYHQYDTNQRLMDNDLKFRLIKMWNGINVAELLDLETRFVYERDNKTISNARKAVIKYEQDVAERAAELERARMKEEEAQKLLHEAEGLKNK